MGNERVGAALLSALLITAACGGTEGGPPPCGSKRYSGSYLIPGPGEPGHDAALERSARGFDRSFHTFHTWATGLNADLVVALDAPEERALVEAFLAEDDGFDFEAARGRPVDRVITSWQKSAGLYAGVGIAADAFRYAVLRDQGYACEEVELARGHLLRDLDALHLASEITGVPGVIARSTARADLPGDGPSVELVPLFDASGRPLPEEKNNGTWRADNSGKHPDYVWEDSCSRDMLVGWAMAYGAAAEVIRGDDSFPAELGDRLARDAAELLRALATKREAGYDLEIPDADGRTTFHGYLNENAFERGYIPGISNGFYAGMAVGITSAFAFAARDPELTRYVEEELVGTRDLPGIAGRDLLEVNLGYISNFSNYNMAFTGLWLASRYVESATGRGKLRVALDRSLYDVRDSERQPSEMKQSFFDFIFAAGMAESRPGLPAQEPFDQAAVGRGLETLRELGTAPYWETAVMNCDEAEISSGTCTLVDGTVVRIPEERGRGDIVVAEEPVPMRVRPRSNYHWRSNPYSVNGGGDGSRLLPAVDYRVAYWLGRFVRGT